VQTTRPSLAVALPSSPRATVAPTAHAMITPGPTPVQPATSLPANTSDPAPEVLGQLIGLDFSASRAVQRLGADARLLVEHDGGLDTARGEAARTLLYLLERDWGVTLLRGG
jgi:hypothetical protein